MFLFSFFDVPPILCNRLQQGMRGAFGKPNGLAARVRIGQPLMSIRVKPQHEAVVVAALKRASYKFAGRQVIAKSTMWGFTEVSFLVSFKSAIGSTSDSLGELCEVEGGGQIQGGWCQHEDPSQPRPAAQGQTCAGSLINWTLAGTHSNIILVACSKNLSWERKRGST